MLTIHALMSYSGEFPRIGIFVWLRIGRFFFFEKDYMLRVQGISISCWPWPMFASPKLILDWKKIPLACLLAQLTDSSVCYITSIWQIPVMLKIDFATKALLPSSPCSSPENATNVNLHLPTFSCDWEFSAMLTFGKVAAIDNKDATPDPLSSAPQTLS